MFSPPKIPEAWKENSDVICFEVNFENPKSSAEGSWLLPIRNVDTY